MSWTIEIPEQIRVAMMLMTVAFGVVITCEKWTKNQGILGFIYFGITCYWAYILAGYIVK